MWRSVDVSTLRFARLWAFVIFHILRLDFAKKEMKEERRKLTRVRQPDREVHQDEGDRAGMGRHEGVMRAVRPE